MMRARPHHITPLIALLGASCVASSDEGAAAPRLDPALSGGDTTVFDTSRNAFAFPARNLASQERAGFFVGNSLFNQNWVQAPASTTARDGLGPLHNALSCSSCHFKDGRSAPYDAQGQPTRALLIRLSAPDARGDDQPMPGYGDQLQPRAIAGVAPEALPVVTWERLEGAYADGTPYTLQRPHFTLTALAYGPLPDDARLSPRAAPAVIGLGLLEAIPEATLLAAADPDDADGDGISGRANWIPDLASEGALALGRFGWKASQPTLLQQNAAAFNGDLGITSWLFPQESCTAAQMSCLEGHSGADEEGVELSEHALNRVTFYTQVLAVPARRDADAPQVRRGEEAFEAAGCAGCHTPRYLTGPDAPVSALTGQHIAPYTDLLLHDMGEGLADGRPDGLATGREWRTPPLWGLGLVERVNGHTQFLHDGRARSFEEAILWHGGEARAARDHFLAMPRDQRDDLLTFLKSL